MIYNKMKKIFSTLLLMVLMVNMLPSALVFAEGPSGSCGENVNYSFDESTGVLTISGNGETENYEFSEDTPWYDYRDSIESVIIRDGITSIGSSAFYGCKKLRSAIIPNSVINIGNNVFLECEILTHVRFLGNIEPNHGHNVFDDGQKQCGRRLRRSLKIIVPNTYTNSHFCEKRITRFSDYKEFLINCDRYIRYKGKSYYRTGTLDGSRFCPYYDPDLHEGNCGEDSTYSFDKSTGILTISGSGNLSLPRFRRKYLSHYEAMSEPNPKKIQIMQIPCWYNFENSIKSVIIKDGITSIGYNVFCGCKNLELVTIPDSVTIIGANAFAGCKNLESITIPDSVTKICANAFTGCDKLSSVTIGRGLTKIGARIFSDCNNLSIIIGNNVTTINDNAFAECKNLTSVIIPDSVTTIGANAFAECDKLSSVTIGNSVTTIGNGAFDKCSSLTSINIPNSVTTIGAYAFAECNLASITIPESVTAIGRQAFNRCYNLNSVTFLGNIAPTAGKKVFNKCSKLKKVTVPNEYTSSSFCEKKFSDYLKSESDCLIA